MAAQGSRASWVLGGPQVSMDPVGSHGGTLIGIVVARATRRSVSVLKALVFVQRADAAVQLTDTVLCCREPGERSPRQGGKCRTSVLTGPFSCGAAGPPHWRVVRAVSRGPSKHCGRPLDAVFCRHCPEIRRLLSFYFLIFVYLADLVSVTARGILIP